MLKVLYSCDTCWRSKQYHPYEKDLLDDELLNDLGLEVFTYKHYCSGDKLLVDHYEPIEKDKITEEFKKHLEELTRSAVKEYEHYKNFKGYNEKLIWEKV